VKKLLKLSFLLVIASVVNANAGTLENVKNSGYVKCGVDSGLPGFSEVVNGGIYKCINVDGCRAMAAAVFGDVSKVKFVNLNSKERFPALKSGKIDILIKNPTWTQTRDASLGFYFIAVNYYDGQDFMVRKKLDVNNSLELDGASICIQTGTTTELNVGDYFRTNNMKYNTMSYDSNLRQGDIARLTFNVMVAVEENGLTSKNVDSKLNSTNPRIRRILGKEDQIGQNLYLSYDWAYNIIKQVGNYAEVFERNIGINTPLKITRGINALLTEGGLQYSPPFR